MPTKSKGTTQERNRRSPKGVVSDKPVAVRFLPGERDQIQAIAMKESRCLSNMTRQLVLMGLQAYAKAK
jgi:hypothetical protein